MGVVSGVGPYHAPETKHGAVGPILKSPRFIRKLILMGLRKAIENNPDKVAKKMKKRFPEADRAVIAISSERDVLLNAISEGLSAGPEGALQDTRIYKDCWGFDLEDVNKKVFLWHGEEDLSVLLETGKFVADHLADCRRDRCSRQDPGGTGSGDRGRLLAQVHHSQTLDCRPCDRTQDRPGLHNRRGACTGRV